MTFASSNRTAITIVRETVPRVTPPNPQLLPIRYTGESLVHNISNETSKEIRDDRMTSDLVQVQSDASGDINIEMSYGSFDMLIEGAMADTFSTPLNLTNTDISASSVDNSFNSVSSGFANVVDGQWISVSGFADSANNGMFKVTAATTSKLIVTATLVTEAAGPSVTVKASMIRNGVTKHSHTIQKHLKDAETPTFFNFRGAYIGGMKLDFQTQQILTGSFSVMALDSSPTESQFTGATVLPTPSSTPMNAVSNMSNIYMDGVLSTASFNSLSMNLSNSLRARAAIGSLANIDVALGKVDLSGGIDIYFQNKSVYDRYSQASSLALSFAITDIDGDSYMFTLPNVKFETGQVVSGGLDTDVMFNATWRAIVDPVTSCMIQIDKL